MGQAAEAAVPALAEAMRGTNVVLCRMAAKALSQIGRPALPTLVSHLKHHDPFVRGEAAVALGWMGPVASAAVPHLIHLLSTAAGSGRYRKLSQPAWADSSNTITPVATPPPSSGEQSVLLQVIQALGRIGPSAQEAMEQLDELADDTRDDVRSAVMSAMRSIRGEDSLADDE
jgi:HEAT repeat protein